MAEDNEADAVSDWLKSFQGESDTPELPPDENPPAPDEQVTGADSEGDNDSADDASETQPDVADNLLRQMQNWLALCVERGGGSVTGSDFTPPHGRDRRLNTVPQGEAVLWVQTRDGEPFSIVIRPA